LRLVLRRLLACLPVSAAPLALDGLERFVGEQLLLAIAEVASVPSPFLYWRLSQLAQS